MAVADAHRLGSLYLPPRPPAPYRTHSPVLKGTADTPPDEEIPEAGTLWGKKNKKKLVISTLNATYPKASSLSIYLFI